MRDMITRRLSTYNADVMCVDITTGQTETISITGLETNNEQKILKEAKNRLESDSIKVVAVVKVNGVSKEYRIPKNLFISYCEQWEAENKTE